MVARAPRSRIGAAAADVRPRIPLAGVLIGALVLSVLVAALHSIPVSFAESHNESAPLVSAAASADAVAAHALASGRATTTPKPANRGGFAPCPECGFIESLRYIVGTGPEPGYEITVRLRDGSRLTLTEPTPRTLQTGGRVIVITGAPRD